MRHLSGRACPECDTLMEWKEGVKRVSVAFQEAFLVPDASEMCPSCDYQMPIHMHAYNNSIADGNALRRQRRYKEAEICLLATYIYTQTLDADHCMAMLYSDMEDLERAIKFYHAGIEHFGSWPSSDISTRQDFLIDYGYFCMITLKQDSAAIEIFRMAIEVYEKNFKVYYNLGSAYARNENFSDAKECYERALEINPDHEGSASSLQIVKSIAGF
ncbi:MAG: tetratricopeptide repeat protein [Candidatus Aenigmarchaeota archaeon]|nr:tetratricopeptide repeat protein [Candidatus Aenigmarchaeota archaeon]MDI6722114.1 tetratricopeptide repeat protein [Candidatus Aenigmarchaeota archaeon]